MMSFSGRFGGGSEDFRRSQRQAFNLKNQKIDLIKSVKEVVADPKFQQRISTSALLDDSERDWK